MHTKNLIIGAGPAGLAVAGRLSKANQEFEILEMSNEIAHRWNHHYDRLHLHTVKELSHLPFKPFPEDYPTYVPKQSLVDYYEAYAKEFNINPHFNTSVDKITQADGRYHVACADGSVFTADNVVIASGINRNKYEPVFENQENYKGTIIHSREYKNHHLYKDQSVLVIGMGNTGAELALDLVEGEAKPSIAVRGEISLVPRDVNGRPVQTTSKLLAKIPFGMGDWVGAQIQKFIFGDLSKYGIRIRKEYPAVVLRETGKTPVIDIGTIKHIKEGNITVYPGIDRFTEDGVQFVDGRSAKFDHVVLATGYKANILDLVPDLDRADLDQYELPKHLIWFNKWKGLYTIGFDNYSLGGILGTVYNDSEKIVEDIVNTEN